MRRAPLVVLAGLALSATACGIPVSSGPHRLPSSQLPASLVERETEPPPNTAVNAKAATVYIYLIANVTGDLVQVARSVSRPATAQKVLDALEAGPFAYEYRLGDLSAVNTDSHLVALGPVSNGTATVELDRYYSELEGEAPVEELAQVVWSLYRSNLGIERVRFVAAGGTPLAVEIDTGRFVDRPVTAADYEDLVANGGKLPA